MEPLAKKNVPLKTPSTNQGKFFGTKSSAPFFAQPTPTLNPHNRRLEREADVVTDRVKEMPEIESVQRTFFRSAISSLQRKCSHCEEEEKRTQPNKKEVTANDTLQSHAASLNENVKPLSDDRWNSSERRFGYDFSPVKVRSGATALAKSHNSPTSTSENKIAFSRGQPSPDTSASKGVLGQALKHAAHRGLPNDTIQRACGPSGIGEPNQCSSPSLPAPESPRYLFHRNCDTFMGDNQIDLQIDASNFTDGDTIEIHGLASEEGEVDYNLNLSCSRAIRAKQVILDEAHARNIHLNIILYAHGEVGGEYRPLNRSIAIRRYTHGITVDDPFPQGQEHHEPETLPARDCGDIDSFFRDVLLIDPNLVSDFQSCLCFGAGIADLIPIPGVGTNPILEGADCLCNVFTALQEVYKRGTPDNRGGGCFSWSKYTLTDLGALVALSGLTYIDCSSLPIGTVLGGWIGGISGLTGGAAAGGTAGSVGGPPGVAAGGTVGAVGGTASGALVGIAIADMMVDLVAMGLQNYITQGTVLPVSQMSACGRLWSRLRQ